MKLTPKQEAYAQARVDGKGPSEAYRLAYATRASAAVVSVAAQKVEKHPTVLARMASLRALLDTALTLGRTEKREILARMVRPAKPGEKVQLTNEQLKAVEIDNKMAGHNEAEKLNVDGIGELVQMIRRGAAKP